MGYSSGRRIMEGFPEEATFRLRHCSCCNLAVMRVGCINWIQGPLLPLWMKAAFHHWALPSRAVHCFPLAPGRVCLLTSLPRHCRHAHNSQATKGSNPLLPSTPSLGSFLTSPGTPQGKPEAPLVHGGSFHLCMNAHMG